MGFGKSFAEGCTFSKPHACTRQPASHHCFKIGVFLRCGRFDLVLRSQKNRNSKIEQYIMASTADISRGLIIKLDNSLYKIIEFGENKTARSAAKVWAKLKGVDNNRSIEKTWNSGETIFPVRVEKKEFQYLYKDDSGYNLMNNETFEQIALGEQMIDAPQFLKEGSSVFVYINTETDQHIGVELHDKIVVKVKYYETSLIGDLA